MSYRQLGFSLLFLIYSAFGAYAKADDFPLSTAQECTRHLPTMERLYNIPAHWLAAMASTESGRTHPTLKLDIPWPWVAKVNGTLHWYDTKQEMILAIKQYQGEGVTDIDVGCMQVNLLVHGAAFANVEQAVDPIYNIAYASKRLREKYNTLGTWTKATAAYHSMQLQQGAEYYRKVYKNWQQIVDRLDELAKAQAEKSLYTPAAVPQIPESTAVSDNQTEENNNHTESTSLTWDEIAGIAIPAALGLILLALAVKFRHGLLITGLALTGIFLIVKLVKFFWFL